jgi:sec-independent protein translocase protein TatA
VLAHLLEWLRTCDWCCEAAVGDEFCEAGDNLCGPADRVAVRLHAVPFGPRPQSERSNPSCSFIHAIGSSKNPFATNRNGRSTALGRALNGFPDLPRVVSSGEKAVQLSRPAEIFGVDGIVVLLVVVLVLFGSTQIPKLARSLGSAQKEFKKGVEEGTAAEDGTGQKPPAVEVVPQLGVSAPAHPSAATESTGAGSPNTTP